MPQKIAVPFEAANYYHPMRKLDRPSVQLQSSDRNAPDGQALRRVTVAKKLSRKWLRWNIMNLWT